MSDDPRRAWIERVLGVKTSIGEQPRSFREAFDRWCEARAEVAANLSAFTAALLSDDAIRSDPRINFVAAAAAEIPRMLPPAQGGLEVLLRSGDVDQAAVSKAVASIADYRRALEGAAGLAGLETFASRDLKFPLAVRKTMAVALDDIERTLRAAA